MPRDWMLEVERESAEQSTFTIRLGIRDARAGKVLDVVSPCRSIAELKEEITRIKAELDQALVEAAEKLQAQQSTGQPVRTPLPDIWRTMESAGSVEEMFAYFNAFGETEREQVAEYIFAHVNMFKGRGPVFSEHYDATSHLLE